MRETTRMRWGLAALPLLVLCHAARAASGNEAGSDVVARSVAVNPVTAPASSSPAAVPATAIVPAPVAAPAKAAASGNGTFLVDAPSAVRPDAETAGAFRFPGAAEASAEAVELPGVDDVLSDPALAMTFGAASKPTHAERKATRLEEEVERNTGCEDHTLHGHACRVTWSRVIGESIEFLLAQHGGNIYMDDDTRNDIEHGKWWDKYVYCVKHYRWSRWKDDDPFGVDYIGHPMMGAMTSSIYEQNDPKQRALRYENSRRYWYGRLRAMAYSAAYSAQWKIGPMSEASIGNTGIGYYVRDRDGIVTNETGMQDWFVTPIGGLAWNVGEDALDRWVVSHIRHAHPRNVPILILASVITPLKSAANLTRFRAMYYRDYDENTVGNRTR